MELQTQKEKQDALEQLDRILQSRTMQGSENLKSFLKYVVLNFISESREQLKEYTIATDVFGRSDDFNPRHDSVVRVQAKRLRDKLREYYAGEGRYDHILIELPKGHYDPVFSFIEPQSDPPPTPAMANAVPDPNHSNSQPATTAAPAPTVRDTAPLPAGAIPQDQNPTRNRLTPLLGAAIAVLAVISLTLALSNRTLHQQVREAEAQKDSARFGPLWQPFLQDSGEVLVVLSNPVTYRFTNPMDPEAILRDAVTLSHDQIKHINEAAGGKFMTRHSGGRVTLSTDEYTGMGEAIGLARITELFLKTGRGALIKQSRTVSAEDLKNHSVILLGSVWVNEWSGKLPIREDFTYSTEATIENQNPRDGEEKAYGPKFDEAGSLIEDYGLITVKPNISYKYSVMVVAGIHSEGTEAAAEYITNPDYFKDINDQLRLLAGSGEPPRYYQALLRVAVDNGMPTKITLLSVHALPGQTD
jgi:hypothetical protein